ncbi:MAG: hypothetical protein FJW38_11905 [Acidobacteria bacterium]|nr:hypothetical protein [Acidobacteriota bacterium]
MTFDPQAGHGQRGRRPAIMMSPRDYNRKVQRAFECKAPSGVVAEVRERLRPLLGY